MSLIAIAVSCLFFRALDNLLGGSQNELSILVEYRQGIYWLLPEPVPAHTAEYLESIAKMDKWDLMEVA